MLNFVIGLLLGGCISAAILCCVQVNRVCYYEQKNPQAPRKTE